MTTPARLRTRTKTALLATTLCAAFLWIAWTEIRLLAVAQQGQGGAVAPRLLPFKGRLLTPEGEPVPEGASRVLFRLYNAPTGGAVRWNSTVSVNVERDGYVDVLLGKVTSLDSVDFGEDLYLSLRVDNPNATPNLNEEPEILPRTQIAPANYSHRASLAQFARSADNATLAAVATNAGVAQNAVTLVGRSWNELLVGGSNDPRTGVIRADKIERTLVPPGTVVAFAGNNIPSGWLLCDGRAVNRAAFPNLFSAIGNLHGGVNASQFRLPDYRGYFLRGASLGTNRDPDRASRSATAAGGAVGDRVGSVQGDATRRPNTLFTTNVNGNHNHGVNMGTCDADDGGSRDTAWAIGDGRGGNTRACPAVSTSITGAHNHSVTGGGDRETRPKNAAVNWIIKT